MTSPRERRGGGQGSFVSSSQEEETKDAAFFSFASRCRSLCSLLLPLPPPALLPGFGSRSGYGSILTSPSSWEKKTQGSSASFSEEKETKKRAAPLSLSSFPSLPPSFSPFLSSPSYSPCYPSPPPGCMCCCVFLGGLIVMFVCFAHPSAHFPHCVRCSALPFVEVLQDP